MVFDSSAEQHVCKSVMFVQNNGKVLDSHLMWSSVWTVMFSDVHASALSRPVALTYSRSSAPVWQTMCVIVSGNDQLRRSLWTPPT
jgi:hypothetical protein